VGVAGDARGFLCGGQRDVKHEEDLVNGGSLLPRWSWPGGRTLGIDSRS
jgi:hypothetical protein